MTLNHSIMSSKTQRGTLTHPAAPDRGKDYVGPCHAPRYRSCAKGMSLLQMIFMDIGLSKSNAECKQYWARLRSPNFQEAGECELLHDIRHPTILRGTYRAIGLVYYDPLFLASNSRAACLRQARSQLVPALLVVQHTVCTPPEIMLRSSSRQ